MIVFMGLAGSGKSTMGQLLAAHLHCPWVSTGNLLRQKMDAGTQAEMLKGKIISDELTLQTLQEEFQRIGAANQQFILDGSPRTLHQAEWLVDKQKTSELKISAVIHLLVPKEVAKTRLLARKRPDDHEAAIAERFREYEQNILPIIEYLKTEGVKVYSIDSNRSPEEIEKAIEKDLQL